MEEDRAFRRSRKTRQSVVASSASENSRREELDVLTQALLASVADIAAAATEEEESVERTNDARITGQPPQKRTAAVAFDDDNQTNEADGRPSHRNAERSQKHGAR